MSIGDKALRAKFAERDKLESYAEALDVDGLIKVEVEDRHGGIYIFDAFTDEVLLDPTKYTAVVAFIKGFAKGRKSLETS